MMSDAPVLLKNLRAFKKALPTGNPDDLVEVEIASLDDPGWMALKDNLGCIYVMERGISLDKPFCSYDFVAKFDDISQACSFYDDGRDELDMGLVFGEYFDDPAQIAEIAVRLALQYGWGEVNEENCLLAMETWFLTNVDALRDRMEQGEGLEDVLALTAVLGELVRKHPRVQGHWRVELEIEGTGDFYNPYIYSENARNQQINFYHKISKMIWDPKPEMQRPGAFVGLYRFLCS